ncbi:very-long-chain ceramide synthase, partial [Nematocida minor]|uniref:very-long-chain ceramide synthase n=1 Tax=Nematocida minor TaxID=1912983 RepID=UPI0022210516
MRKEWENRSLDPAIRLPTDIIMYVCGIVVYTILHRIVKTTISELIIRKLARVKNPADIDRKKFTRALWKVVCFGTLSLYGIYCLAGESWIYYPLGVTMEWPNNQTPSRINNYYVIETVYYSGSFITMFFEEKQSDFYLMVWHHFVTLLLVGFSYRYNFLRYGVFIMLLHDISDPWMDSAKISVYLGYQSLGNVLFIIFAGMFIIPRIFIYLYMVLFPGYGFLWEFGSMLLVPIWGLLLGVFLLNSYWSVLIIRMAVEFIKKGKIEKDIRDVEGKEKGGRKEKGIKPSKIKDKVASKQDKKAKLRKNR